jgi:hypothetical protein
VAKWISRPTSNREIAGSIPASDLSTFSRSNEKWIQFFGKCFPVVKNNCLYGKEFCPFSSVWSEHQSYELRVGSSSLPMDIWSSLRSIWVSLWCRRLAHRIFTPVTRVRVPSSKFRRGTAQGAIRLLYINR